MNEGACVTCWFNTVVNRVQYYVIPRFGLVSTATVYELVGMLQSGRGQDKYISVQLQFTSWWACSKVGVVRTNMFHHRL